MRQASRFYEHIAGIWLEIYRSNQLLSLLKKLQIAENKEGRTPMRIIAIMNQKGGVGKTTSSVNIAAGLARLGKRVCLIDLDSQGNSSSHLGIDINQGMQTIYQVFSGERKLIETRQLFKSNLWVVPANIDLAAVEVELVDAQGREFILKQALEQYAREERDKPLDYVIMD